MKFSLKTFLISLCVVGAVCGVMGKLLIEQPETFITVIYASTAIGPFLLAIGTIIRIGWQQPPRRGLVTWGCVLLFAPLILYPILTRFLPPGNPIRLLSTQRLIQRRLPTQTDQPWVWQELDARAKRGSLTNEDIEDAIQQLISFMRTTKPSGWNQPFSWQRDFLATVTTAGLVSNKTLLELCDAFYGTQPTVRPIRPIAVKSFGNRVQIDYGGPWEQNTGFGVYLLWDVKQVLLDGKPIKVSQARRFVGQWSALLDDLQDAGDHELQFDIECAYVDASKIRGGSSWSVPRAQWPTALKQWTTTLRAPLRVTSSADAK
jgi:hypothetical protein